MAENSKIQWTDHTFNPWAGCQRVSPGCEHCYAEAYDKRVGGALVGDSKQLRWGPTAPRVRTSAANWRKPLKWNRDAAAAGVRRKVFCASLADVFEDRPELVAWREDLFFLILATPHLDWLLLTKRPENLGRPGFLPWWPHWASLPSGVPGGTGNPWPNVWLGTTVEDQQRANERIPHLIAVPAAVRFLSMEPLLEAVDLSEWLDEDRLGFVNSEIDWVIVGGESGPGARPFDLAWARSIVWQCRNGGRSVEPTPFVKQLGAKPFEVANVVEFAPPAAAGDIEGMMERQRLHPAPPGWTRVTIAASGESALYRYPRFKDRHGGDPAEWPEDLRVREFPEVRR